MKKTFWGYDVREADEVIDSLRSQNSILSSKLTKLNMELAAKSEMETPAPAAAVPEDMRRELEELRAANAELTARAARLQEEAQKLHGKIGALEREKESAPYGINVGPIYARAYENVEKIRAELIEEMQERIQEYAAVLTEADGQLRASLEQMAVVKEETTRQLVESYEAMLENLEDFAGQGQQMAGALPEVSAICEDLTEKMNALFTATLQEEREQIPEEFRPAEEPEEEPEENAALPPLLLNALRSFREERREKEPAAPEERADTPVVPASTGCVWQSRLMKRRTGRKRQLGRGGTEDGQPLKIREHMDARRPLAGSGVRRRAGGSASLERSEPAGCRSVQRWSHAGRLGLYMGGAGGFRDERQGDPLGGKGQPDSPVRPGRLSVSEPGNSRGGCGAAPDDHHGKRPAAGCGGWADRSGHARFIRQLCG